jgi:hypothetical protein
MFEATAVGLELSWEIELGDIGEEDENDRPTGQVTGKANGMELDGVFDVVTRRSTASIALDYWLPPETKQHLTPLAPVLEAANAHYASRAAVGPRVKNYGQQHGTMIRINWGKVACWGFAGLGAAAACAGSAGVGCLVGGGLFGAAASICCQVQD